MNKSSDVNSVAILRLHSVYVQNMCFVGNLILNTSCEFHDVDIRVVTFPENRMREVFRKFSDIQVSKQVKQWKTVIHESIHHLHSSRSCPDFRSIDHNDFFRY